MLNADVLPMRSKTLQWPENCGQQVRSRWTCANHSCRGYKVGSWHYGRACWRLSTV